MTLEFGTGNPPVRCETDMDVDRATGVSDRPGDLEGRRHHADKTGSACHDPTARLLLVAHDREALDRNPEQPGCRSGIDGDSR